MKRTLLKRAIALIVLLCATGAAGRVQAAEPPSAPKAQDAAPAAAEASVSAKLAKRVRLTLGTTTAAKAIAALAEQTGVPILLADYLRERKCQAQFEDISGAAALDALAELNDWTWYEADGGRVRIVRRTLRVPQTAIAIPRLMQNALPADFRKYLDIPRPGEDMAKYANPLLLETHYIISVDNKIHDSSLYALLELNNSFNPKELATTPVKYTAIKPEQQTALLTNLVYGGLNWGSELLRGDLNPNYLYPEDLQLQYEPGPQHLTVRIRMQLNGETKGYRIAASLAQP